MANYIWEKYSTTSQAVIGNTIGTQARYAHPASESYQCTLADLPSGGTSGRLYYSESYTINNDGTFTLTGTIKYLSVPITGVYFDFALYKHYCYAYGAYENNPNLITVSESTVTYTYEDDEGTEYVGYRKNRYDLTCTDTGPLMAVMLPSDSETTNQAAIIVHNVENGVVYIPNTYQGTVTSSARSTYPSNGVLDGYYYIFAGASSTATYIGASNVATPIKDIYVGVSGVARKIKKVYVGVNGIAQLVYDPTTTLTTIGSSDIIYTGDYTDGFLWMDDEVYRLLTLTSSGTLTTKQDVTADVWMVGGGNGGSSGNTGSGTKTDCGGAGAYSKYQTNISLSKDSGVAVVVGSGGSGGTGGTTASNGSIGGYSSFGTYQTAVSTASKPQDGGTGGGNGGTGDGIIKYPFETTTVLNALPHSGGGGAGGKAYYTSSSSRGSYKGGDGGTNGGNGGTRATVTSSTSTTGGVGGEHGGGAGGKAARNSSPEQSPGSDATYYGSGGGGGGSYGYKGSYTYADGGDGYQGIVYVRIPLTAAELPKLPGSVDVPNIGITYTGDYTDTIVTMKSGTYRLLTLTSSGTLTLDTEAEVLADIWMCSGGNGGMGDGHSGGGGGPFIQKNGYIMPGSVVCTIGAGAKGAFSNVGQLGGSSSFGKFTTPAVEDPNSTNIHVAACGASGGGEGGYPSNANRDAGYGCGQSTVPFEDTSVFEPHSAGGGGGGYKQVDSDGVEGITNGGGAGGSDGASGKSRVVGTIKQSSGGTKGGGTGGLSGKTGTSATFYGSGGGGGGGSENHETGEDSEAYGGSGYQGVIYVRILISESGNEPSPDIPDSFDPSTMTVEYTGDYTDEIITMDNRNYRLLTLTSSGTLNLENSVDADVWMCNGGNGGQGGGGSSVYPGVGGGGGYVYQTAETINGPVVCVIGSGGTGSTGSDTETPSAGGAGGLTSFGTAKPTTQTAGKNGASGGGGHCFNSGTYGKGAGVTTMPFNSTETTYEFMSYHSAGGGGGGYRDAEVDTEGCGGVGGENGGRGYDGEGDTVKTGGAGGNKGGGKGGNGQSGVGNAATWYGSGGGGGGAGYASNGTIRFGNAGTGYQGVIYVRIPI